MIQFAIYQYKGGPLIADYSSRIQAAAVASNNRGFAECRGFIPLGLPESFRLYDRTALPHVAFSDTSSGAFYEGRLEDVNIVPGGVNITAYGYAQAMGDFDYNAMWSTTQLDEYVEVANADIVSAHNEQFTIKTYAATTTYKSSFVFIPNAGSRIGLTPTSYIAYMVYKIPDQSTRQIVGISFDWVKNHPAGAPGTQWTGACVAYQPGFASGVSLFTTGAGVGNGTQHLTFAGQSIIGFAHFYDGANGIFTPGATGDIYFSPQNIRIVTSIANRVNTTFTVARVHGTNVTATVGSTARMYVGQELQIANATQSETVVVISIGSATQFNATFTHNYIIGNTVQAHVVYADEIINDMVSLVSVVNPTQLSSTTALVQSPGFDLTDQTFVDMYHQQVLDQLAGIPDSQSRLWEWGVQNGQQLYFRPQSTTNRTWYIDVSELDVQRTLSALWNSVYATYQDANGKRLRGGVSADAASAARYGVTRQKALAVSTTSLTQANSQAAAALADSKDPSPRASLTIDKVYDGNGVRWPLYLVRAGDTIVIRNLPPTLSTVIDKIRIFRLTRAEYAIDTDTLTIEPETPLPTLDVLIAQQALGQP